MLNSTYIEKSEIMSGFLPLPQKRALNKTQRFKERILLATTKADFLLSSAQRRNVVNEIRNLVDASDEHFAILYQQLIDNFVEFVQILPKNNSTQLCGLLDEGLLRALFAMQAQRKDCTDKDEQSDTLMEYTLFSAALLFDVGFVINDRTIIISEHDGSFIKEWHPHKGSLQAQGATYYRIRNGGGMPAWLSRKTTTIFARQIMPFVGFNWIAQDPFALNTWIDLLNDEKTASTDLEIYFDRAIAMLEEYKSQQNSFTPIDVETIEPKETANAEDFLDWLEDSAENHLVAVNDFESGIHVIEDGFFIELPYLFRKFSTQLQKQISMEQLLLELKKLGFIDKPENETDPVFVQYSYSGEHEAKPISFIQQLAPQKQNSDQNSSAATNENTVRKSKRPTVREGVEIFLRFFLPTIAVRRLTQEKNLCADEFKKEKKGKRLLALLKRKRRIRKLKKLLLEVEEALRLQLKMNMQH